MQKAALLIVKADGTHSYHWALKDKQGSNEVYFPRLMHAKSK
jgi:hypothetical protein